MSLQVTDEDRALLRRVRAYCERGLSQPEMATAEGLPLSTFRLRLYECGFRVESNTHRRLVRTGTGEEFAEAAA